MVLFYPNFQNNISFEKSYIAMTVFKFCYRCPTVFAC
jgi:hypothetical protein